MYDSPEEFLKWATVHMQYITAPEEPMHKEATKLVKAITEMAGKMKKADKLNKMAIPALIGTNAITGVAAGGIGHHVGYGSGESEGYKFGLNDGTVQANKLHQVDLDSNDFMKRLMYLFSGNGSRLQNSMEGFDKLSPLASKYLQQ